MSLRFTTLSVKIITIKEAQKRAKRILYEKKLLHFNLSGKTANSDDEMNQLAAARSLKKYNTAT